MGVELQAPVAFDMSVHNTRSRSELNTETEHCYCYCEE